MTEFIQSPQDDSLQNPENQETKAAAAGTGQESIIGTGFESQQNDFVTYEFTFQGAEGNNWASGTVNNDSYS